jgi:hypothetical protein
VISRRTISLIFLWVFAIAIPTSFSKGRIFQLRQLEKEGGIEKTSGLDSWPIVFVRTVTGGQPDTIRRLAIGGVLLTGLCIVSAAFDFAPKSGLTTQASAALPQEGTPEVAAVLGEKEEQ